MTAPGTAHAFLEAVWADGAALYDRRSGDTHLLDLYTLAVLHAARIHGPDACAISAHLDAEITHTADPARIESTLDQLLAARLL